MFKQFANIFTSAKPGDEGVRASVGKRIAEQYRTSSIIDTATLVSFVYFLRNSLRTQQEPPGPTFTLVLENMSEIQSEVPKPNYGNGSVTSLFVGSVISGFTATVSQVLYYKILLLLSQKYNAKIARLDFAIRNSGFLLTIAVTYALRAAKKMITKTTDPSEEEAFQAFKQKAGLKQLSTNPTRTLVFWGICETLHAMNWSSSYGSAKLSSYSALPAFVFFMKPKVKLLLRLIIDDLMWSLV